MKRFCFILLCTMLVSVLARAQENKPVTQAGTTSLNFTFHGFDGFGANGAYVVAVPPGGTAGDTILSRLNNLLGDRYVRPLYGLGVTFYVADNVGLRIGFAANMNSDNTPNPDSTKDDDIRTRLAIGFSPALQIHVLNSGPVSVYTGVVFSSGFAFSWFGADENRTLELQSSFGGGVLLGTEFYPLEFLSLGAETQFGIERSTTSRTVDEDSADGPASTAIGFMLPVRVNLSFHI
jgi:hypothetical protein